MQRSASASAARQGAQRSGDIHDQIHGQRPPLKGPSLVTMMDVSGNMDRSDEGAVLHYDDSFQQALRASIAYGFQEVQNEQNAKRAANQKKHWAPGALSDVRLLKTRMRVFDGPGVKNSHREPLLSVQYQILNMDDPK